MAVAVSAIRVILGWPFSILAFLLIVFYSLSRRFKVAFLARAVTSVALLALSVLIDYYFYKRWTSSVLNLLVYNVLGGRESHLYGIEGPLFYIRNGFNNFNFCFILALLFLAILPIARKKYAPDLLVVVFPLYIWLVFMSLQPHKEERFLYPIYPLVCVAASAVIESFPDIFRDKYNPYDYTLLVMIAKFLRPVALGLILYVSHARTFSLVNGYAAPIHTYKILEHHDDVGTGSVLCAGSEAPPQGIATKTTDLEIRSLWNYSTQEENEEYAPARSLLAMAVDIKQKETVNKIVEKFLASDFVVMFFHYDGLVDD